MIGRVLSNRYQLLERVGGGGMAFVYKARDQLLNRIVAVKILSPHFTDDDDFVRKFRREAQAAAGLSSSNIVGIYDVGKDGGVHYIVMEFLRGKTLKQILKDKGPLGVTEVLQIGKQIASALATAHKHGVVHRDIKPHNIMLTSDGQVKVTDFGIARAVTSSTLTETGAMVGSVHYLSPEQARGGFVGELSDIYSFGVVLYELLSARVPFEGDSMFSVAIKHLQEEPRSLRELVPGLPVSVARIVEKAMSKEQANRYQSAELMVTEFDRLLQAGGEAVDLHDLVGDLAEPTGNGEGHLLETTLVPPDDAPPPSARKRRPWWLYLLLGSALVFALGILFLYVKYRPGAPVEVPQVIGLSLPDAQRLLSEKELGFFVGSDEFNEADPNVVIDQDIPAEQKVRAGRVITLTISKGPEYADVPDVTGKTLRAARIELQNAGFEIAEPVNRVFSDKPADQVLEQNPTGNTRLKRSTPIILTVSKGAEPKPFNLPSLVGMTGLAAQDRLAELELVFDSVEGPSDGVVVSQTPAAGTQVVAGQTVDLILGPKELNAAVVYTVPENSEKQNHQIEIIREDVTGTLVVYSRRHRAGDIVQQSVSGTGFLRVLVRDEGEIVKEEVYP